MLAHVGLVLIGEGEAELAGEQLPGGRKALARAGLAPVTLGRQGRARDLLELGGLIGRRGARAGRRRGLPAGGTGLRRAVDGGLSANLSPIDPRVVAARPAPGQAWAAAGLAALLAGGSLTEAGRRAPASGPAQLPLREPDPRLAARRAGSARRDAMRPSSTAPPTTRSCLHADERDPATGNFHVPALALALDARPRSRSPRSRRPLRAPGARLRTERLSGLPGGLTAGGPGRTRASRRCRKTAQALTLEIRHLAAPVGDPLDGQRRRRRGRLDRRRQAALRLH